MENLEGQGISLFWKSQRILKFYWNWNVREFWKIVLMGFFWDYLDNTQRT